MKKCISAFLCIIILAVSCCSLCSYGAGGVMPAPCVTWSSGIVGVYEAEYVEYGTAAKVTDYIPNYPESETHFFNFAGWFYNEPPTDEEYNEYVNSLEEGETKLKKADYVKKCSLDAVKAYLANEPVVPKGSTLPEFVPQPLFCDTVYLAYYDKVPKKFALTKDTVVDINDVTILLNLLSGVSVDLRDSADTNLDGAVDIVDVTTILNYLTFFVE